MAKIKIPFSKLKLTKQEQVKSIKINDIDIEVTQYLSTAEKLELITSVMDYVLNDNNGNNFLNPVKVDVYTHLEIVFRYTNLTFTDVQKRDIPKLYDILESNGVIASVINALPQEEYTHLIEDIDEILKNYIKYKNSFLGVLDTTAADYKDFEVSNEELQKKIADSNNLPLLKKIVDKMG